MAEATINIDLCQKLKELLEVMEPDLDGVKDTISRIPDSYKKRQESSWSPVITAIKNHQEEVLDVLVKAGFLVNGILTGQAGIYGWCAVGAAVDANNYKLAKHLVDAFEASANLVRMGRETLLTTAITRSDWPIVTLLLEELKANPNLCVQYDSDGGQISPIHLAIWNDFYKARSDWRMTKLLLKNGAKVTTQSDWNVLNGKILLGVQKGTKGNASNFAEALKATNPGRIDETSLDFLIELLKEQSTIQDLCSRIEANQSVSLSALGSLNSTKAFPSSPLVTAAKHGRYDLVELMVRTLGFDVNAPEEWTGLNPLAAAVECGDTHMVRYLVKELGANVDAPLELELVPGKKFKCTTLTVAVDQDLYDPEMWRLLVEELGADVNLDLEVDGYLTSLLHHAIFRIQDQKSTKILALLLSYGAKADKISWTWLSHGLCQVTPLELAVHLQARSKDDLLWYEVAYKLTNILFKEETDKMKKMESEDLIHHAEKERLLFEWHRLKMNSHQEILAQKLGAANQNVDKIKDLQSKKDYMTEEEISTKEKEFWRKVSKSKAIEAEIKSIVKHENYMTEEKLQLKKDQLKQVKQTCLVCEKKFSPDDLKQCKKKNRSHIFCNRCTHNKPHCAWCRSESFAFANSAVDYAAITVGEFVDPMIAEAERLLERLKALQDSKDLLSKEELEIQTRKHEAEIERATILNKLISSIKKTGDPDFSNQFKNTLKSLRTMLGTPDDHLTAAPAVEALATAEPEAANSLLMADPEDETSERREAEGSFTEEEELDLPADVVEEAPPRSALPNRSIWAPQDDSYDEENDNESFEAQAPAPGINVVWPAANGFFRAGTGQGSPFGRNQTDNRRSQAVPQYASANRSFMSNLWN